MNESPLPSSLPEQNPSTLPANFVSPGPRRPRWLFWLLGSVVAVMLLCAVIMVVAGLSLFQNSQSAATDAIKVVDKFMQAGARENASAGFALFSPTVQNQQITQEGIAKLFRTYKEYFTNYVDAKQESFSVTSGTAGVTASLEGIITYTGRPDRKFAATLIKENDQWSLINIRLLEEMGK